MITFFMVVSILIIGSIALALFFNLSSVSLLPTVIFSVMIWLTVFGVIDQLLLGLQLILPLALSLLFFGILRNRHLLKTKILDFVTPAGVTFLGFCLLTFLLSRNMQFVEWDEFTHWGFIVKVMFLFDVLGPLSPAHVIIPSNLPGLSVISYAIVKIGGNWTEGDVFWAYQLLFTTLIAGSLWRFRWRGLRNFTFSLALILISSVMFFNTFGTVYADPALGLIFGYTLFLAVDSRLPKNKWLQVNLAITLTGFILVKELAIALALITITVALGNVFLNSLRNGEKFIKAVGQASTKILLFIIGPLILRYFWGNFLAGDSGTTEGALNSALAGTPQRFQAVLENDNSIKVISNVYSRFKSAELTPWNGFSLTGFEWFLLIAALLIALSIDLRKEKILLSNQILAGSIIIFGFVYYLLVLSVAYLTVYSGASQESLTSFERYFSAYPAGALFFIVLYTGSNLTTGPRKSNSNKEVKNFSLSVYLLVLFFLFNSAAFRLTNFVLKPNEYSTVFRSQYLDLKNKIISGKFSQDNNFWIIAQHTIGFENYLFQYELLPASVGYFPFSIGSPSGEGDIWTEKSMTSRVWEKALIDNKIDFVQVVKSTESFKDEFGELFENPETLLQGQGIYKVNVDGDEVQLTNYR